jgi:serpin B
MRTGHAFAFALALGAATLGLAACHGGPTECTDPDTPGCMVTSATDRITTPAPAADVKAAVADNTTFAIDVYRRLSADPGNVFYSPFSISEAMAMVSAGAKGETQQQIAEALRFSLPQARLHPAFNDLDQALASRGQDAEGQDGQPFALNVANALWGQLHYQFQAPFLDTLAQNYGAGMHVVDFAGAPSASVKVINDWVSARTEDKIQNLLSEADISGSTKLVLTNAIYFNARWATPFDEADTKLATFTRADGTTAQVQTMSGTVGGRYAAGAGYEAVSLPYDGSELSMILVLPTEGTLEELADGLDGTHLAAIAGQMSSYDVTVHLPRFKMETKYQLAEHLSAMGMPLAFSADADFSGISTQSKLFISKVIHQAFVNVNESGTEAAAATAVVMRDTAAAETVEVSFDRPFLFFIRDDATGSVLFLGRVSDPG